MAHDSLATTSSVFIRHLKRHRQTLHPIHQIPIIFAPFKSRFGYNFLIYGIGGLLGKLRASQGISYTYGSGKLQERQSIVAETVKPNHVFNAAGVTGSPNVDWCESHKVGTIRTNVAGTLTHADDAAFLVLNSPFHISSSLLYHYSYLDSFALNCRYFVFCFLVGNIPSEATEEQLREICGEVVHVLSFRLVADRETGKPKGFGFCEYKDKETSLIGVIFRVTKSVAVN